jgi:hypothetical protein
MIHPSLAAADPRRADDVYADATFATRNEQTARRVADLPTGSFVEGRALFTFRASGH